MKNIRPAKPCGPHCVLQKGKQSILCFYVFYFFLRGLRCSFKLGYPLLELGIALHESRRVLLKLNSALLDPGAVTHYERGHKEKHTHADIDGDAE